MDFYHGTIPILDPLTPAARDELHPKDVSYGLVQRDYNEQPRCVGAAPGEMELVKDSELDARFDEQEATESSLEHIFLRGGKPAFVNLDQNGDGDCWAYSTGQAMMLAALRDHGTVTRLNPHFIATYLRRYNGGWAGASMKVAGEVGCLPEGDGAEEWPLHSHDARRLTEARISAAAAHKVTENWYDAGREVWNQELTTRMLATCGFLNVPAPSDFNWWGHSVCQVRWVRIERGSWGPLILNSWRGWGRFGLAVLRGSQAIADGAVAVRTTTPS